MKPPTPQYPTTGPERRPAGGERAEAGRQVVRVRRLFASESANYFLLLGTTLFLVVFGLVMVLSSSAIEQFRVTGDFFGSFLRQGLYAIVGIPAMLLASRMPARFWQRWAWHAIGLGVALQLLVLFFGIGSYNRNWLDLGAFTVQPSEFVKLALVIWLALVLTKKRDLLGDWRQAAVPIAPVAGGAILLVLIGNDLGTAAIMLMLVLGAMFFAGVRVRFLAVAVAGIAFVVGLVAVLSPSRLDRIMIWLNGCTPADYDWLCWQPQHGLYALASGGLFGVGLGNSKAKWSWLPEADNDFIFAIIGEELGMLGAIVVLVLFVVLAIAFARIVRSTADPFARTATSAVMVWVIGQAMVNIAVVLGMLPVLGVPLPLISAGGSALIATLIAIGVVLSFARARRSAT